MRNSRMIIVCGCKSPADHIYNIWSRATNKLYSQEYTREDVSMIITLWLASLLHSAIVVNGEFEAIWTKQGRQSLLC
jgi:hypothetical protein